MKTRQCTALSGGVLLAVLLAGGHAIAQPPPTDVEARARSAFEAGKVLRDANHWDDACVKFTAAYNILRTGGTTLAFAECEQRAGRLKEARAAFQSIVDDPRASENPERLQTARDGIADIDGKLAAPPRPPAPPVLAAPRLPVPAPVSPSIEEKSPPPGPREHRSFAPGGVTLGIGGTLLVAGGALGGVALSKINAVKSTCMGSVCPAAQQSNAETAQHLGNAADVCFGVGAAAAVVGVVLLVRAKSPLAPAAVAIVPTPRGLAVRF